MGHTIKRGIAGMFALLIWGWLPGAQAQIITTVAGTGVFGYSGDSMPATSATFGSLYGITVDGVGNLYICDPDNYRLRKVNTAGIVTTIAGDGTLGSGGDGGPASAAQLRNPIGVAADTTGNLYISDNGTQKTRKIDASGIISTFAGTGTSGYTGDGGPATAAELSSGTADVSVDMAGNVYIADAGNHCVRKITASDTIYTIAGNGTPGFSGDGTAATAAQLFQPFSMCEMSGGNMYMIDFGNVRIRKVDASGNINTISGNGTWGYGGDGGPASAGVFGNMGYITADTQGDLYIGDWTNNRIRKISASDSIYTIAGTGTSGYSGDGGPATDAKINGPGGIVTDAYGNVYFADWRNFCVRKISLPVITITTTASDTLCRGTAVTFAAAVVNDASVPQYRWQVNGVPTGANTPTYVTDTLPAGSDTVVCILTFVFGDVVTRTSNAIIIQVDTFPHLPAIAGADSVCAAGAPVTLTNSAAGGAWSMSNASATISGGVVSGITAGADTALYIIHNACGSDTARHAVAVVGCPDGIAAQPSPQAEMLHIIPNPGNGEFSVSVSSGNNEAVKIVITNMMGEPIKEWVTTTNKAGNINLDAPAGVYFLSAATAHGKWSEKVVVVR